ncbi:MULTISPECIES: hypothetical protein [Rhizobium]|uniref:Uncharacterized protein n=1 Tax=Rhizobium indicum TaxID=2583231 RepID=A0ABX6PR80_9HYPH|nr:MULTISPECIES: hypothetical protein [Rhizobium]NEI65727.1 hypothetical protein [Rhizobium leguminosarum]QIJ45312.1 hypothetical protein G7039_34720 [Rhizobium leguminosarum]QKK21175.1 hypothetical protein FFM53_032805 [Rhizobium indicum]QKK27964.1 hypothetical protein FFM81_032145 [Rhizobium hidalgonense]QKK34527.1 hypothetical protein FE844_035005 [Rhizobium indicum]
MRNWQIAENVGKFHKGTDVLAGIRDKDVDVGATPKTYHASLTAEAF